MALTVSAFKQAQTSLERTLARSEELERRVNNLQNFSNMAASSMAKIGEVSWGFAIDQANSLIGKLKEIGSSALKASTDTEVLAVTLNKMQPGGEGAKTYQKMTEIAEGSLFEKEDILKAINTLRTVKPGDDAFVKMVGDLAAAKGKTMSEVANVFSQLNNGDYANGISGAISLGISRDQLMKQGLHFSGVNDSNYDGWKDQSKSKSQAAIDAVTASIGTKYKDMMKTQADTLKGTWGTIWLRVEQTYLRAMGFDENTLTFRAGSIFMKIKEASAVIQDVMTDIANLKQLQNDSLGIWEKIGAVWDAINARIRKWFDADGQKMIEDLGKNLGSALGSLLTSVFGGGFDAQNSVFVDMGKTLAGAFIDGFRESFKLDEIVQSGIGKGALMIGAAAIGGKVAGPGGALLASAAVGGISSMADGKFDGWDVGTGIFAAGATGMLLKGKGKMFDGGMLGKVKDFKEKYFPSKDADKGKTSDGTTINYTDKFNKIIQQLDRIIECVCGDCKCKDDFDRKQRRTSGGSARKQLPGRTMGDTPMLPAPGGGRRATASATAGGRRFLQGPIVAEYTYEEVMGGRGGASGAATASRRRLPTVRTRSPQLLLPAAEAVAGGGALAGGQRLLPGPVVGEIPLLPAPGGGGVHGLPSGPVVREIVLRPDSSSSATGGRALQDATDSHIRRGNFSNNDYGPGRWESTGAPNQHVWVPGEAAAPKEPGKWTSRFKGGLKGVGRRLPVLGTLMAGAAIMQSDDKLGTGLQMAGNLAGGFAGGEAGAALGGAIGTALLPGAGTAVGAAVGGLAGGIAGAIGGEEAVKWLQSKTESMKGILSGFWSSVQGFFGGMGDWFGGIWDSVAGAFSSGVARVGAFFGAIPEFFGGLWESVSTGVANGISSVGSFLGSLPEFFANTWNNVIAGVSEFGSNLWNNLTTWVGNALTSLGQFFLDIPYYVGYGLGAAYRFITQTLPQLWAQFSLWIGQLPANVGNWMMGVWSSFTTWLTQTGMDVGLWVYNIWNQFTFWLGQLPANIGNWMMGVWSNFTTWLTQTWTDVGLWVYNIWSQFTVWLGNLPSNIENWMQSIWTNVTTWLGQLWTDAGVWLMNIAAQFGAWFETAVNNAVTWVQELPGRIAAFIQSIPERIAEFIDGVGEAFLNLGSAIINGIRDGITGAFEKVSGVAHWAIEKAMAGFDFVVSAVSRGASDGANGGAAAPTGKPGQVAAKQYHGGGLVEDEGWAILKRKEMVLDENLSSFIRTSATQSAGGAPASAAAPVTIQIGALANTLQVREEADVHNIASLLSAELQKVLSNQGAYRLAEVAR